MTDKPQPRMDGFGATIRVSMLDKQAMPPDNIGMSTDTESYREPSDFSRAVEDDAQRERSFISNSSAHPYMSAIKTTMEMQQILSKMPYPNDDIENYGAAGQLRAMAEQINDFLSNELPALFDELEPYRDKALEGMESNTASPSPQMSSDSQMESTRGNSPPIITEYTRCESGYRPVTQETPEV